VVTVIFGVVAVGATAELFFANVDICGESHGWWLAGIFLSPLIFVGLCAWCAEVAKSAAEQGVRSVVATFLMLPYICGVAASRPADRWPTHNAVLNTRPSHPHM